MIYALSFAPVLAGAALWRAAAPGIDSSVFFGSLLVALVLWILAARFVPQLDQRFATPSTVVFVGAAFAVGAIPFLVKVVYPNVPQEIGGVKPRCGYVEISRTDASSSLARELFASNQIEGGIVRSRKLSIFFSGGDSHVVRARHLRGAHTYELRKEIVKSVSDC
jgi:hypothetical protein